MKSKKKKYYFGPADIVLEQARYSERDNKHMIAISKLKELKKRHQTAKSGEFFYKTS